METEIKKILLHKISLKILGSCQKKYKENGRKFYKKERQLQTVFSTLKDKLEVIAMRESGATFATIASDKKIPVSTI